MNCPYCGGNVEFVGGSVIYPYRPDLYSKKFYLCEPCGAYVGCHRGTDKALGRLANAELRKAKMAAHAAFDPLWTAGIMKRWEAYAWLAEQLGLPRDEAHIGMFDVDMCRRVVEACGAATPAAGHDEHKEES